MKTSVRWLLFEYKPLDVLRHNPESNSSRARINYQASALPVLTRVMQQFPTWARSPEPAVLTFDYKDTRSVSSFLRRNFGWSDQYFFWCRDHQIPNARTVPDDKDVMMALYSNRNLLMPIDICGVGPRKLRAYTDDHGVALTIFYGTLSIFGTTCILWARLPKPLNQYQRC